MEWVWKRICLSYRRQSAQSTHYFASICGGGISPTRCKLNLDLWLRRSYRDKTRAFLVMLVWVAAAGQGGRDEAVPRMATQKWPPSRHIHFSSLGKWQEIYTCRCRLCQRGGKMKVEFAHWSISYPFLRGYFFARIDFHWNQLTDWLCGVSS